MEKRNTFVGLVDPLVKFIESQITETAVRDQAMIRLQEAVFWAERALADEVLAGKKV